MSSEIENQIGAVIGAEHQPKPTKLHYFLWGFIGLLVILLVGLLVYVLFFLLRTAVLFGIVSLSG